MSFITLILWRVWCFFMIYAFLRILWSDSVLLSLRHIWLHTVLIFTLLTFILGCTLLDLSTVISRYFLFINKMSYCKVEGFLILYLAMYSFISAQMYRFFFLLKYSWHNMDSYSKNYILSLLSCWCSDCPSLGPWEVL